MTDYSDAASARTQTPEKVRLTTFPAKGHQPIVEWEYPEFQCLCPVSDRHDQGVVVIKYKPTEKILESKSVRDYLSSWRTIRTWQEFVTDEITKTLFRACEPEWLTVTIAWSPRGGIFAKTRSSQGSIPENEL